MATLITIPAYNEEENIIEVIESIIRQKINTDILVIDDGSSDNTAALVQKNNKASLIVLPQNLGMGGAFQTGLKYAKRNNYDIVVNVDGDDQHRADEIKKIMEPVLQKKADVVIGSRLLLKDRKYPILGRRIAQKIISFLILLFSGKKITDSTSGFRCYNKKAIDLLSQYYPTDYPGGEEVVFLIKNGIRIKEVATSIKMRKKGSSFVNIAVSIHYMIRVALSIFINVFRASIIKEDKN